jgi:cation diffusion facilitator family transporter
MHVETSQHDHIFLGERHAAAERYVWATVALTVAMMVLEIVGGAWFGSLALMADGFHMSTHAGALIIAALAYTLARRHARNPRFTFGAGKFGDLAGFSSALILTIIAVEIGFEAAERLAHPQPVAFAQAIPIAALGLVVNVASAWLLSRGGHHHHHGGGHGHDEERTLSVGGRTLRLSIFEDGVPPRFRLEGAAPGAAIATLRPDGSRQTFTLVDRGGYLESIEEIPEPHDFTAIVTVDGAEASASFVEHDHVHRDNNLSAAILHVLADAAVSVFVIFGLVAAYLFDWLFMDPLAALVGALVIASWAYQLIRATGAVLLDVNPDPSLAARLRACVERDGDALVDLHIWRLGPGHLGAIVSVGTANPRDSAHYRARIGEIARFSHLTIEVHKGQGAPLRHGVTGAAA